MENFKEINELFLTAKRAEKVNSLVVKIELGRQFMYLCFDDKYSSSSRFIECDIDVIVRENYRKGIEINKVCFLMSTYYPHINEFLQRIKKGSKLKFEIVAFNDSENLKRAEIVRHEIYGKLDGKTYLLASESTLDNWVSPVQYKIS